MCEVCTVNYPRVGEPTCNACRPKEDIEAEQRDKAATEALNDHVNKALDAMSTDCVCGNEGRLIPDWEDFCNARFHQIEAFILAKDYEKIRIHMDKILDEYRTIVESITDLRCATCA